MNYNRYEYIGSIYEYYNDTYFGNLKHSNMVELFHIYFWFVFEGFIKNKLISNKVSKYIKHRENKMMGFTKYKSSYSEESFDNKPKLNALIVCIDSVYKELSNETGSVYVVPASDCKNHESRPFAIDIVLDTALGMHLDKKAEVIGRSRKSEILEELNRDEFSLYDNFSEKEYYFTSATFWHFEKCLHKISHRTLHEMLFNTNCLALSVVSSSNLTSYCLVDSTSENQAVLDKYRNETDISEPEEVSIFCEKVNALLVRLINLSINCVFDEDVKIRFMGEEVFINSRLKSEWIYTLHEVDSFKEKILFTFTRYQDAKNIRKRKVPFYKTQLRDCINQNLGGYMELCTIH